MNHSVIDQVCFQFSCFVGVVFGFCYIPSHGLPYYNYSSFSAIKDIKRIFDNSKEFITIGDVNSKFGLSIRNLPIKSELPDSHFYTYPYLPDDVSVENDSAYVLGRMCSDNDLLVLNDLSAPAKSVTEEKTMDF